VSDGNSNFIDLRQSVLEIIVPSIGQHPDTFELFEKRLAEGALTRDENPQSHFSVYFLPLDFASRRILLIHHRKSGLWLSPGGHLERGETILEALNREIKEELGLENYFASQSRPFFLSITSINNSVQPCKTHFDIWFLLENDGTGFRLCQDEFLDSRWSSLKDARRLVVDPANVDALARLEKAGFFGQKS
jgi:8-oxo-dGTP pyrophosphatase MutT (NUDIX family)